MRRLLMGNRAIAFAAIEAGINVACGYPGTPSTEIIETIADNNPSGLIHVEWSTNEKAALELAAGVSYSHGRVLVTCKQVGMNVAADPLMSLVYVGTRGGMVVVVADDPGPISSQTEQDSRQFAQFAHVPVLDPASPEEAYLMTKYAFELSEAHHTPVIVRPTTRIDHGCASIEIPDDIAACPRHEIAGFDADDEFVIFPPFSRRAHGRIEAELACIAREFEESPFNSVSEYLRPDHELFRGIVCSGVSRAYTLEALERLHAAAASAGQKLPSYRLLQVGTPFPFPDELGLRFMKGLAYVLVIEELESVVERTMIQISGLLGTDVEVLSPPCVIHGRLDGSCPPAGEYSCELLIPILAQFLGVAKFAQECFETSAEPAPAELLAPRPAVLCAGCPHRASFLAVKKAAGRHRIAYTGDIGCYTLGCNKPLETTDTCLCMGAGVTIAQGLQTAAHLAGDDDTYHVGFVGDSTFFASAMTGLANAVYNRHRMVLCVLDNSTTAMTGAQPHPGIGRTLMKTQSEPISISNVCRALGCDFVESVDPLDFDRAVDVARRALACEGVAVVVFESPCVQLFSALQPPEIGTECVGCARCVKSLGCPALSMHVARDDIAQGSATRDGIAQNGAARGHAVIDATQCSGCDLCVHACSFGAIHTPRSSLSAAEIDSLRRGSIRG